MAIEWWEDNSNDIEHTVDGSGADAVVTAYLRTVADEAIGDPITLEPSGTDDHYSATVHPTGAYDLEADTRYRLRIVATYGGATLETEYTFKPRVRRTAAA